MWKTNLITLTSDNLRSMVRYEDEQARLYFHQRVLGGNVSEKSESYRATLADFMTALKKIKEQGISLGQALGEWLLLFSDSVTLEHLHLPDFLEKREIDPPRLPETEGDYIAWLLLYLYGYEEWAKNLTKPYAGGPCYDSLFECEVFLRRNEMLPAGNRDYPDFIKYVYMMMSNLLDWEKLQQGNRLALYEKFTDELLEKEIEPAMRIKAYQYYEGTPFCPQDWQKARELLEKILEKTGKGYAANSLGYIAYYGRCQGGKPDYEAAYRYFTYAALQDELEAGYKLADMLAEGKGIWKNTEAAYDLIAKLYEEGRTCYCRGTDGKFADLALRMGRAEEEGWKSSVLASPERGYRRYLEARFAIGKRMQENKLFGDEKVAANIEAALARVEKKLEKGQAGPSFADVSNLFTGTDWLYFCLKHVSKDLYRLTITPDDEEYEDARLLWTMTWNDSCALLDSVVLELEGVEKVNIPLGRPIVVHSMTEEGKEENCTKTWTLYGEGGWKGTMSFAKVSFVPQLSSQEALGSYKSYLKEQGISFNEADFGQTLEIKMPGSAFGSVTIEVSAYETEPGFLRLFKLIGYCEGSVKIAQKTAKSMQKKNHKYKIWLLPYNNKDILMEEMVEFAGLEDLHQKVQEMAETAEKCMEIGERIAGECFTPSFR